MKNENSTVQKEVVALIEEVRKEVEEKGEFKKWKKYYGDVCVRIFREFILREIPSEYTVSSPNAYIKGFPTEFDLLLVEKDAAPMKHTNAYLPEKVKCVFEIKAHGTGYGSHENLEKDIKKIKDNFDAVRKNYQHINFVYLTYKEVAFPKKETSIRYLDVTTRIMEPYKVFCLKDSRTGELIDGAWEKFSSYLKNSLQR